VCPSPCWKPCLQGVGMRRTSVAIAERTTVSGVARIGPSCERLAANLKLLNGESCRGMTRFRTDQATPRDKPFVIALAALKLDHFQRTGDPCIRTGKKPNMIGAKHGRKD
jgi:hypothetical protein